MSIVLPLASGKGGVGKSVLAANLAIQLASRGKSVILADLDWGGSNAHTILGVLNTNAGLGDYMLDKERTLASLVLPLEIPRLSLIPGDGQVAGAANIPLIRKQKLIRELTTLEADYVVLDLGAGTHTNTVDVFLSSAMGFLVTTPEPTAILNAYGFLKTALYRLLYQSVPSKTEARLLVQEYFAGRGPHKGSAGLDDLIDVIGSSQPVHGEKLAAARKRLRPRIVLNEGMNAAELKLGARLRQVCERQLGLGIEYVALVPFDPEVRQSVIDRKPISVTQPQGAFAQAVGTLADRIVAQGFPDEPPLANYDDLEGLNTKILWPSE